MNYKRIHDKIIANALQENRVKYNGVYFELHHITPDFMYKNRSRKGPAGHLEGNPNSKSNKVLLTAREHLLVHILLYKIHKDSRYRYQCASSIGFFIRAVDGNDDDKKYHPRDIANLFSYSKKYEVYKLIANEAVSSQMKGMLIVKVAKTGVRIPGRHPVTHPKIVSGEWVHHCKGIKRGPVNRDTSGNNNPNYKEVDLDALIYDSCMYINQQGNTFNRTYLTTHLKTLGYPVTFHKKFGKLDEYKNQLNIKYFELFGEVVNFERDATNYKTAAKYCCVNNGTQYYKVLDVLVEQFYKVNTEYVSGRKSGLHHAGTIKTEEELKLMFNSRISDDLRDTHNGVFNTSSNKKKE